MSPEKEPQTLFRALDVREVEERALHGSSTSGSSTYYPTTD